MKKSGRGRTSHCLRQPSVSLSPPQALHVREVASRGLIEAGHHDRGQEEKKRHDDVSLSEDNAAERTRFAASITQAS
jgi:hypothetical protein